MGPVELAVRARFSPPVLLHTVARGKPFELYRYEVDVIVLRLGPRQAPPRVPWTCLEEVPAFLTAHPGWVRAGGRHRVVGEPGTLDELTKRYLTTDVARWLAVVLDGAGVVELDEGRPLRVRLTARFGA